MGAEPIVYLTPINCMLAKELDGPAAAEIIGQNAAAIRQALSSESVTIVDMTTTLAAERFFESPRLTTHYDAAGRMRIAEALGAQIKRMDTDRRVGNSPIVVPGE
jgi:hypothetical protein